MSVWYAIPSARPAAEARTVLSEWRCRGYKIALLRQGESLAGMCDMGMHIETDHYLGWAYSVNRLAQTIVARDPTAQWIVTGGDDYLPDRRYTAQQIAEDCYKHFLRESDKALKASGQPYRIADYMALSGSFGVMQPTGDRYGAGTKADIETAAASPWIGREWILRSYGGSGPLWDWYYHYFADTELQHVAQHQGVFWQRPDLTQEHKHWTREAVQVMPSHLAEPTRRFVDDRILFEARQAKGFPGHEPI